MLFDKNGFYMIDDGNDYDFAVDIANGTFAGPKKGYMKTDGMPKMYNADEALKRGNLFPGLYDSYRGYKPGELKVSTNRERSLLEIQMLDFAINDLNLYLDLHPEDEGAYDLFAKYVESCKRKKDVFTRMYGPLLVDNLVDEWEWSKGVWPWEEGEM